MDTLKQPREQAGLKAKRDNPCRDYKETDIYTIFDKAQAFQAYNYELAG